MRQREQEPRISSPAADRPEVDMPFSACPISAGALSAHSQTAVSEYVPPVYSGLSAPVYPPQILRFHSACAGAACHGTSSVGAGPVAVSPASTAAALRPAVRSFEKTPCLAPFLWYNCCEFTIRRRRSRPGRNRFYPAAALKTFLTCAGFAVPTLFARQGSPCGQSSHRQKGFDRSPPLRYHGGSQMSGIAETTERLFGSAVAVSGIG